MVEIRAAPNADGKAEIRYTTDGSDPKLSGGIYADPVEIFKSTQVVLATAMRDGITSDQLNISISWDRPDFEKQIDADKPLKWNRKHECASTMESYAFIQRLKEKSVTASGIRVTVTAKQWAELTMDQKVQLSADTLREAADLLRKLTPEGQPSISRRRRCTSLKANSSWTGLMKPRRNMNPLRWYSSESASDKACFRCACWFIWFRAGRERFTLRGYCAGRNYTKHRHQ